jgi:hypothetical protein
MLFPGLNITCFTFYIYSLRIYWLSLVKRLVVINLPLVDSVCGQIYTIYSFFVQFMEITVIAECYVCGKIFSSQSSYIILNKIIAIGPTFRKRRFVVLS